MIVWLIGKSDNVDLIYSAYQYTHVIYPEIAINKYLFDEMNFKYIFNKKNIDLFKKNHDIFQNTLLIKGLPAFNKEIMDNEKDSVIYIDHMSKSQLFNLLISIHKISFDVNEMRYINSLPSLIDLSCVITLKKLNLHCDLWPNFIYEKRDFWSQKAKNNTLIHEQIVKNDEILPMINYLIMANHKQKAILTFIKASIKSGEQIWTLSKFWETLIKI